MVIYVRSMSQAQFLDSHHFQGAFLCDRHVGQFENLLLLPIFCYPYFLIQFGLQLLKWGKKGLKNVFKFLYLAVFSYIVFFTFRHEWVTSLEKSQTHLYVPERSTISTSSSLLSTFLFGFAVNLYAYKLFTSHNLHTPPYNYRQCDQLTFISAQCSCAT